jgi:hypothetical protein
MGKVTSMIRMVACQPQKVKAARVSENSRGLAGALQRVVAGGELRAAGETEDHQAGVQGAQAAEAEPGGVEVECRPDQLSGDQHAGAHAHHAPEKGHQGELADDLVVVGRMGSSRLHRGNLPYSDCGRSRANGETVGRLGKTKQTQKLLSDAYQMDRVGARARSGARVQGSGLGGQVAGDTLFQWQQALRYAQAGAA